MPTDYPWGMPPNYTLEGYQPPSNGTLVPPPGVAVVASVPPPIIPTAPIVEEPVYHTAQSEEGGTFERMDEFQDQFAEMQKEIKDCLLGDTLL